MGFSIWLPGNLTLPEKADLTNRIIAAGIACEGIGGAWDLPGQLRLDFKDGTTQAQQDEAARMVAAYGFVYQTSKPIYTKEIVSIWRPLQGRLF